MMLSKEIMSVFGTTPLMPPTLHVSHFKACSLRFLACAGLDDAVNHLTKANSGARLPFRQKSSCSWAYHVSFSALQAVHACRGTSVLLASLGWGFAWHSLRNSNLAWVTVTMCWLHGHLCLTMWMAAHSTKIVFFTTIKNTLSCTWCVQSRGGLQWHAIALLPWKNRDAPGEQYQGAEQPSPVTM